MVMEVRQEDAASQRVPTEDMRRSTTSSVYSSTTASTGGGRAGVRRVKMYHVATPPDVYPEEFAMSEISEADSWRSSRWGSIRMISLVNKPIEAYEIFDTDDVQVDADSLADDAFYEWLSQQEQESFHVRMVQNSEHEEWVVLDSGADLSLLPSGTEAGVELSQVPSLRLEDAQGKAVKVQQLRKAQLSLVQAFPREHMDECVLDEEFVVANVTNPLLSLGRLLKHGWIFGAKDDRDRNFINESEYGPCAGVLIAPDKICRIPVFYKRNSLSILACVRRVEEEEIETKAVCGVTVSFSMDVSKLKEGWQFLQNGSPCHFAFGRNFHDFTNTFSAPWRYRTTIAKVGNHWEVIELCTKLSHGTNDGLIPGLVFQTSVLTFPSRNMVPLSTFQCEVQGAEDLPSIAAGHQVPPRPIDQIGEPAKFFPREPLVPDELRAVEPEVMQQESAGGLVECPDSIFANGQELNEDSPVKFLREACEFFGVSQSGSKRKLFERLCNYIEMQYKRDAVVVSENLRKKMLVPELSVQKAPDSLPGEEEQARHAVTHLPFQSWCSICVKAKSREDKSSQSTDFDKEDTGIPSIQMDWSFLGKDCPALCMLDTRTRFCNVFPTTTKGAYRQAAEAAVRFSLDLGYLQDVNFIMDSEPATLSLLDLVLEIRRSMGYPGTKIMGKPYHKGRTARVERQIQTMKHQAMALVMHVEEAIGMTLEETHVLRAWALVHSCFLLNRFHDHRALRGTPFEIVYGKKYDGKLMPFGEFCFGLKKPSKQKGVSTWTGGIWVGKDQNDMNIIVTPTGQFASRSVRRCATPWRKDVINALVCSPWLKQKGPKTPAGLGTPLPVIMEAGGYRRDPREGEQVRDQDALDAAEAMSSEYAPTTPGGKAPVTPPLLDAGVMQELKEASSLIDDIEMASSLKRSAGGEEGSPRAKAAREC